MKKGFCVYEMVPLVLSGELMALQDTVNLILKRFSNRIVTLYSIVTRRIENEASETCRD